MPFQSSLHKISISTESSNLISGLLRFLVPISLVNSRFYTESLETSTRFLNVLIYKVHVRIIIFIFLPNFVPRLRQTLTARDVRTELFYKVELSTSRSVTDLEDPSPYINPRCRLSISGMSNTKPSSSRDS